MVAFQLNDQNILLLKHPLTHYWTSPLIWTVEIAFVLTILLLLSGHVYVCNVLKTNGKHNVHTSLQVV